MSEIGKQLIYEYLNETNERLEDDKQKILLSDTWHFIKKSIYHISETLPKIMIFMFVILAMVFLYVIDESTVSQMRLATDAEIVRGAKGTIKTVLILTVFIVTLNFGFNAVVGRSFFGFKKNQRLIKEQENAELVEIIVRLNEELLKRHKLINLEKKNDQ